MATVTLIAGMARAVAAATAKNALHDTAQKYKDVATVDGMAETNAASLAELARLTEVEAITIIDNSLTVYDSTTDVLKYINSLFAGWYLSSASIMTDTGRIKTVKLLERLNPSKSPSYALANTILSGVPGVPSMASMSLGATLPTTSASLETNMLVPYKPPVVDSSQQGVSGMRVSNDLTSVANLSVGQTVTLSLSDAGTTKEIQVNIRLITVPTNRSLIRTILTWSNKDLRLKSRMSAWRAGELRFWRDVVLMRDLFTDRKRIMMNDKSELLQNLLGRQRDSMLHSVLTATPSVGTMSSVLVISSDTLRDLEQNELDGRLRDYRFRQRIMNSTGLMVIAVVDPLSEFVTVYTHTQSLPSEYSIKQLKGASKGGSADLGEIIKLMNQNQMPNF